MKFRTALVASLLLFSMDVMADAQSDARDEAKKRISPIVSIIGADHGAPCNGFQPGKEYTISWSMIGYDDNYTHSSLALYDCTDKADGECGEFFGNEERILTNVETTSTRTDAHDWTYKASNTVIVTAYKYDFNTTFTLPDTRVWDQTPEDDHGAWNTQADGGNFMVARFFQMSDAAYDAGSRVLVSVLIGARAENSYGDYSRRVQNKVFEDATYDGICPTP